MTGFMQPPVADEPAALSVKHVVITVAGLIVILMVYFRLTRAPEFDESEVTLVPPAADNFARASDAYRRGDVAAAYGLLRPLADVGDVASQRTIGWMHANGFSGRYREDRCKAVRWFEKAAHAGDPFAMAMLGDSYNRGAGVERDDVLSYFWFRTWQDHYGYALAQDRKYAEHFRDEIARSRDSTDTDMQHDPAITDRLTNWDYRTAAPVVPRALPNIPLIDTFVQLFWIKTQGCDATLFGSLSEDQIVSSALMSGYDPRFLAAFPGGFGRPQSR